MFIENVSWIFLLFCRYFFPLLYLDLAAGTSADYYNLAGTRFTYTSELRDKGHSFLLPPNQITPSGEEMWAAFAVMFDKVLEGTRAGATR